MLNLVPLLNEALKTVQTQAPILVERNVTLPSISADEIPAAACEKIGAALHLSLPATCGQVRLIPAAQLASARRAVRLFEPAVIALIIITPLIGIAALVLSQRRRTLPQLFIGSMLGVIVLRRIVMWLQTQLIDHVKEENKAAAGVIVKAVLHGLLTVTMWLLIGGLIVVVLALVTGPYKWAVAGRAAITGVFRGAGRVVSTTGGQVDGDRTTSWVSTHLDAMRIGGVVVATLLVLLTDVNVIGFVVIIVLLGLYELLLYRMRPSGAPQHAGRRDSGLAQGLPMSAESSCRRRPRVGWTDEVRRSDVCRTSWRFRDGVAT